MRILFFGIYDPAYSRNRVLAKGLASNGAWVLHCTDRSWGPLKYVRLAIRLFALRHSYDVMVVAFPGQAVMLLARLMTRRPVIFDAFTSHYEGYVLDRTMVPGGGIRAWWYRWLDRTACRLADAVITDTQAHIDFFVQEYGLNRAKFYRVFVGTDTDVIRPDGHRPPPSPFTVHFHGHYIPLQGVRYIVDAAALLRHRDIMFNLIGRGQTYTADHAHAKRLGLRNITFIGEVPYEHLRGRMAAAHVCLGIFGDTSKTQRVIPNKVFEALAMARPLITADTSAIRELLSDESAVLVPAADPRALADAIVRLKDDSGLRERIARAGHEALKAHATPAILGKQVLDLAKTLTG